MFLRAKISDALPPLCCAMLLIACGSGMPGLSGEGGAVGSADGASQSAGTGGATGLTALGGTIPSPPIGGVYGGAVGTGGSGGAGGTPSASSTWPPPPAPTKLIGETIQGLTFVLLDANLVDGAVGPPKASESWALDGTNNNLSYTHSDGTKRQATLTSTQTKNIFDLVVAAKWHTNKMYESCCTDGPPYAPTLTLTSVSGDWTLGVSSNTWRAPGNRAFVGDVIMCTDYAKILPAFQAVIAGAGAITCSSEW